MLRAAGRLAFGLPRYPHALPHGNPQLAEDVWKLFGDGAQDLCFLSLPSTTAQTPLHRGSVIPDLTDTRTG